MKILQVNKYHYYRAGAEKYYLDISHKLEEKGHQVAYFSMLDEKNLDTKWNKYFVSKLDFHKLSLKDKIKLPGRIIYSLEAKRKFKQIIKDFKPDIIHAHNIYHHISPSIFTVAKKEKIPVVLHLQDYKLICPNYNIYSKGKNHWDYCGGRFYRCFLNKAFKNSYLQSFLVSLEYFIHHYILNIYNKNVSTFIAPSLFMKDKLKKFHPKAKNIKVINNHVKDNEIENKISNPGNYWLYFGRLAEEKGVQDLITAFSKINDESTLKILGEGPYEKELKQITNQLDLNHKVEFLGKKQGSELKGIIKKSKTVIIPSIWPENFPFALLESLAMAKPAIVSKSGGMPEIIDHQKNGLVFETGNIDDLINKMLQIDKLDYQKMSQEALKSSQKYNLNKTIEELLNLYKKVLKENK